MYCEKLLFGYCGLAVRKVFVAAALKIICKVIPSSSAIPCCCIGSLENRGLSSQVNTLRQGDLQGGLKECANVFAVADRLA
jgi:hypothetical protein